MILALFCAIDVHIILGQTCIAPDSSLQAQAQALHKPKKYDQARASWTQGVWWEKKKKTRPWKMSDLIEEIHDIVQPKSFAISHILRSANKLANSLATGVGLETARFSAS